MIHQVPNFYLYNRLINHAIKIFQYIDNSFKFSITPFSFRFTLFRSTDRYRTTNGIIALCNCSSSKSFEIPDKGCSLYDHHHATPVNRLLFTDHGVLCNTDKSQVQVERSFPCTSLFTHRNN